MTTLLTILGTYLLAGFIFGIIVDQIIDVEEQGVGYFSFLLVSSVFWPLGFLNLFKKR